MESQTLIPGGRIIVLVEIEGVLARKPTLFYGDLDTEIGIDIIFDSSADAVANHLHIIQRIRDATVVGQ